MRIYSGHTMRFRWLPQLNWYPKRTFGDIGWGVTVNWFNWQWAIYPGRK